MEATLVIPIYIYTVMTILYLIQLIGIKSCVAQALYDATRTLSRYAYAYAKYQEGDEKVLSAEHEGRYSNAVKNGITIALAQGVLFDNLGLKFAESNYVVGGNAGFNMTESSIMDGDNVIELVIHYSVKNPFDIFGIGILNVSQSYKTEAWLGEDYEKGTSDTKKNTRMVYITATGEVYHTSRDCTYLSPIVHSISRKEIDVARNASGAKYYACEKCVVNRNASTLYITEYGDRYHESENCTSLKRMILQVPLDSVGERRPCSKCAGGSLDEGNYFTDLHVDHVD